MAESTPPEQTAQGAEGAPPILRMTQISKGFPGVQALRDVHLEVRKGEVHALIGENGAGKSPVSLSRIDSRDRGILLSLMVLLSPLSRTVSRAVRAFWRRILASKSSLARLATETKTPGSKLEQIS